MTNHIIPVAQVFALYQSESRFPIKFDDAWEWIGYSRKNNAKRALLSCGFEEGIDLLIEEQSIESQFGTPEEYITITVDCFKMWAMMAATEKGRQARLYFLECERTLLKQVPQILAVKSLSLLNLEPTSLYGLMGYLLAMEYGAAPNPKLIEDLDPSYLEASIDAVQYAYHSKNCQVAEVTKLTNDVMREIGWISVIQKEIDKEKKDIAKFAKYVKLLEAGKLGGLRKEDFDRFESKQAALAGNRSLALQGT